MPVSAVPSVLPPAPAYRLPGVKLFASGMYRGQPWPPARVNGIADNIRKLGPSGKNLIVPPAVLGHEEDQDWLEDTSLPAAGWVDPDSVTTIPDPDFPGEVIITGDVVNIPPEAAQRIFDGEYANGSGEFYELLDDFGKPQGYTMRRFGLLGGGTIPQVKRLGRLPALEPMAEVKAFSEKATNKRIVNKTIFLSFAERTSMDRNAAMAAIKAAMPNISQATLDALSDDKLKDWVANLPTAAPATPTPAAPMGDKWTRGLPSNGMSGVKAGGKVKYAGEGDPTPSRNDMTSAMVAKGQDPNTLAAMSDDDLKTAYSECMADEPKEPDADDPTKKPVPTANMSEIEKKAKDSLDRTVAIECEAGRKLAAATKREKDVRKKDAETFCEGLVKAGKLLPHQKADYVTILTPLNDTLAIHKFAENGKTETLTAFELKKKELERRPKVVVFGEKIAGGGTQPQDTKATAIEKAKEHAATVPEAAWKQTSFGSSAGYVQKFGEIFDKSPESALKMLPS